MRVFLAPLMVALFASVPAMGQTADSTAVERLLRVEQKVRVAGAELPRIDGRIRSISGDSVYLADGFLNRPVAIARIDSLWTGKRQYKRGALIGAVAGAVLGIAAGVTIQSLCEEGSSINGCSSAIPILGASGAASGTFYGLIIGALFHRWELRAPPR